MEIRPKKTKVAVAIIIILGRAAENLNNDIADSVEEIAARRFRDAMSIFDGDEEGLTWNKARQDVYDAMEAIADVLDVDENADIEALSDALQVELDNL